MTGTDPRLAGAVRMLHRRYGWIWTTGGAFLAFLVAVSVYSNRVSATGSGPVAILIIVMVLGALTVVGLIVAVTDTVLLVRLPAARYPPRHVFSWVFSWLMLICVLGLGVLFLPGVVNGVSYLAGGNSVTFVPESYGTSCSLHTGCSTVTEGTLQTGGAGISATWPDEVPLGHPFLVRKPVWTWGVGSGLIDSDRIAVVAILVSLLFIGASVAVVIFFVKMVGNRRRHRRMTAVSGAAP
jgi:hypothetical protein